MNFLKSIFGQNEDDRLYDEFLKANEQMNLPQAKKCLEKMTDEGLINATVKIDKLAKRNPSYMILNTLLFSAFAGRPHLKNPFQ
jgi:hypothetical protein